MNLCLNVNPKDLVCEVRNLETKSVLGPCAKFAKCEMFISRGEYAGRVHFQVFLYKSTFCSINGHPKQYILVDTIFNYRFHFGLQEHVFEQIQKIHLFGAGSAGAKKVFFEDLSIYIFLEVQNEPCS